MKSLMRQLPYEWKDLHLSGSMWRKAFCFRICLNLVSRTAELGLTATQQSLTILLNKGHSAWPGITGSIPLQNFSQAGLGWLPQLCCYKPEPIEQSSVTHLYLHSQPMEVPVFYCEPKVWHHYHYTGFNIVAWLPSHIWIHDAIVQISTLGGSEAKLAIFT